MDLGPFTETDDEAQTVCGAREADFSGSPRPPLLGNGIPPLRLSESEIFAGAGRPRRGFSTGSRFFPRISESSLAFQRRVPSQRRTTKRAGFPRQGHRLRKFPLARSGIVPPGSPEIFERCVAGSGIVPQSYRERNFRPPGSREAGFSSSVGIFPSLSKKLWIIGSLHREGRRSPDALQNVGKRVSAS